MKDAIASERALKRHGIPLCLHVPTAAVDEEAISLYVGEIVQTLSGRGPRKALLVRAHPPPTIDPSLPIWTNPRSDIFHRPLQVWVHIDFTRYRRAYQRAFPDENLGSAVLSHCMNRRMAAAKGFAFVRITPATRSANSSSAFSEGWGVELHSQAAQMEANRRRGVFVEYADLTDLMLMLDIKLGGGLMDVVNEGRKLLLPAN